MPELSTNANIAQIFSVIFSLMASMYGVYRRMDKRQNKLDSDMALVCQRLDFIVNQFGPNGGGLRQAVNEMSSKIDKIETRQIAIGDKVARLQGEFDQHIVEND